MAIQAKSDAWVSRMSRSSGPILRGRTDEGLARNALVPVPIFVLGFNSSGAALTGVTSGTRPPRPAVRNRAAPAGEPTPNEPSGDASAPPARAGDVVSEAVETGKRPEPQRQGDTIDLIIDKLPRHALVKPIPVTIAPLGDRVFIASTPDLDITVTGNSLSDALLLLKQQLESTYESLRGKASTREQEKQLRRLHDYIRVN
jgi:hypothetical protein